MEINDFKQQSARWLGVNDQNSKSNYACIFVPSFSRDGRSINHAVWEKRTVKFLSKLFGGATSVKAYGGWYDEIDDKVKQEKVSMVVSFF